MTDVIILANGSVNEKLPFLNLQKECPALMPVHTKPILFYILEFYKDKPIDKIYLVISSEFAEEISSTLIFENISIVSCPPTKGVNETLKYVVNKVKLADDIIVNLVTTIPTSYPLEGEVQIGNKERYDGIGSGIVLAENSVKFAYKDILPNENGFPFTGIFRVNNKALIKAITDINVYDDLLRVVSAIFEKQNLDFKKCEWIDCGHEISFYKAKEKLLQSRPFNSVKVYSPYGIIEKHSSEREKLKNEFDYINALPDNLKILFPRITSEFTETDNSSCYSMEFYGYPNLAEFQLFWKIHNSQWAKIFKSLDEVLTLFSSYSNDLSYNDFISFYFDKTFKRVEEFRKFCENKSQNFLRFDGVVEVNDIECDSFFNLIERIRAKLDSIYDSNFGCIMHGDFCFNNILYDIPSGTIRLIDQRGSYGESKNGIWGDRVYDLAKFAHSSIGMYDYLANGLFSLSKDDQSYRIEFFSNNNSQYLRSLTHDLIRKNNFETKDIEFIIGLLFVSMSPMHSDSFIKQVSMYLHGLKYINNSLHD